MNIGCDLCFEVGLTINILDIICNPSEVGMIRTPFDCVMTTPNGTDVITVNDPTFYFLVTSFGGSVTASISEAGNPESFPGGIEVLGTWTCQCNNSDGHAIATSTLVPCCELYDVKIDHNICILYSCMDCVGLGKSINTHMHAYPWPARPKLLVICNIASTKMSNSEATRACNQQ